MLVMAAWLGLPDHAHGQRVDVEVTGGASVGNYTDTGAGLDILPGPSFGARVDVWPTDDLAGYIGFTRSMFGCEESLCTDRDVSLTSQGVVAGARWSPGLPWLRAGVAVHTLNLRASGDTEDDFDPGFGFELAGGLDFGLADLFRVRPGVRYLRHGASSDTADGHVALLALEVGVSMTVARF